MNSVRRSKARSLRSAPRRTLSKTLFVDADRRLEMLMANSANRTAQLAASVAREVERLKDLSEGAGTALARVVECAARRRRQRANPDR